MQFRLKSAQRELDQLLGICPKMSEFHGHQSHWWLCEIYVNPAPQVSKVQRGWFTDRAPKENRGGRAGDEDSEVVFGSNEVQDGTARQESSRKT